MSKMIILRGLSGSGKSTKARELAKQCMDNSSLLNASVAVICSADDYFMRDGTYKFDARELREAHAWCKGKAVGALEAEAALVIIDNTNVSKWEYEPYEKMASDYGAECEVVVVGEFDEKAIELYASRNKHGVPIDKIRKKAAEFQRQVK